jgi:hypothetical protein
MIYFGLFDEPDLILLRKCAVFYMAVAGDVNAQGIGFERMNDITPHKVKTDLLPMIHNAERFDLQTARERVSTFLYKWMALTNKDAEFLKHFAAGRYEPELLFEDETIVKRIENHPMALWRLRHIREGWNAR